MLVELIMCLTLLLLVSYVAYPFVTRLALSSKYNVSNTPPLVGEPKSYHHNISTCVRLRKEHESFHSLLRAFIILSALPQVPILGCRVATRRRMQSKMGRKVCVTAAGGFIGSSLVKNLLQKGYTVHATCRQPENQAKTSHLLSLPGAKERLTLFKADLFEPGSFDSAIQGCDFVINLATTFDFTNDPETGFIKPCVDGTLDILRACKAAKTVRRVIHTSSICAALPLKENGEFKDRLDESCWTPLHYLKSTKPCNWMYYVAKTLAEQAALQFGKEHNIQVVSLAVALVAGPSLTPTFSISNLAPLSPLTGNRDCYEALTTFQSLLGSVPFVHVEDVCEAMVLLMEHHHAEGRYVCSSEAVTVSELTALLRKRCPEMPLRFHPPDEKRGAVPILSKKLCELGFDYKRGMSEMIEESIGCAKEKQVL